MEKNQIFPRYSALVTIIKLNHIKRRLISYVLAHKAYQPFKREKASVKFIFYLIPSPYTLTIIPCAFVIYFTNSPPDILYFLNCEPRLAAIFVIRIERADNFAANIPTFAEVENFIRIFKYLIFSRGIEIKLFRNFNRLARV